MNKALPICLLFSLYVYLVKAEVIQETTKYTYLEIEELI